MFREHDFMRSLSTRSILDKNDKEKLAPHIQTIVDKLRTHGKDPLELFIRCRDYLERRVNTLERTYDKKSFEITNKDPRRAGTLAWLLYMKYNLSTIIQILSVEKLKKILQI